jgi:Holliday junction resolvase RusA-like endonuclease
MISFTVPSVPEIRYAEYKQLVAVYAQCAMKKAPLLEHPVRLRLDIYCKLPGRWSKKRRADALAGIERPSKDLYIDNVAKVVADGMNGIVWVDDSQIVELVCSKHYALESYVSVSVTRPELEKAI